MKTVNSPAVVIRRCAAFLIPPAPEGIARHEAAMAAHDRVEEAMQACVRAGRDDLAMRLLEIGQDLRGLSSTVGHAPQTPGQPARRPRKLGNAAPGKAERQRLARRARGA